MSYINLHIPTKQIIIFLHLFRLSYLCKTAMPDLHTLPSTT
jgi:hypothetical protein